MSVLPARSNVKQKLVTERDPARLCTLPPLPLALPNHQHAINARHLEPLALRLGARPFHFEAVHLVCRAQPEVYARVVAGEVAVSAEAEADSRLPAGCQEDLGADRVALTGHGQDLEPVAPGLTGSGRVVAVDAEGVVEVDGDQVHRAA